MNDAVLHVTVGGNIREPLESFADSMNAIEAGITPEAHFAVGFQDIGQLLNVFTPRRWDLLETLRHSGPLSISALARILHRDYKNVHGDVSALLTWGILERNARRQVLAPFAEISIDIRMPEKQVA